MTLKEITPEDSVCPVFIEPINDNQIESDAIEREEWQAAKEAKAIAKAALLERLGITAEEAQLLLT